ncbi:MAG TPA: DUF1192 domain-containing protein [Acetobacteraceae bacterium]|nr:DUF1192 domain-containing protein [Acetobacteraceae bacterium]
MTDDDETPKKPPSRLTPPLLDPMGLAELTAYREELRAEITRVEVEMTRKQGHRDAANAFFRRGPEG